MAKSWYDINKDGKRIDAVIKMMWSKARLADDPSLQLAYIDRVIKATNTKVGIAETVLGIKQILAEARKSLPQPQIVPAEVVTLNNGK